MLVRHIALAKKSTTGITVDKIIIKKKKMKERNTKIAFSDFIAFLLAKQILFYWEYVVLYFCCILLLLTFLLYFDKYGVQLCY